MKTNKVLKRIAKIEALMSKVTERSSPSAPHIRQLLRDAKAAVTHAKEAVSLQASTEAAKDRPAKAGKPPSKATPEHSKPKPKLSKAVKKTAPPVAKRAAVRKSEARKAPVKKAQKAADVLP